MAYDVTSVYSCGETIAEILSPLCKDRDVTMDIAELISKRWLKHERLEMTRTFMDWKSTIPSSAYSSQGVLHIAAQYCKLIRGLWMATELRNRAKEERALLDLAVHLGLSREDRAEFSRIMEEKIDHTCMEAHTTFELHITKGVVQFPANARAIADEGAIKIEASAAHTMIKEKIAL